MNTPTHDAEKLLIAMSKRLTTTFTPNCLRSSPSTQFDLNKKNFLHFC